MSVHEQTAAFWSDALAESLMMAIPDDQLVALGQVPDDESNARSWLLQASRDDAGLRWALMRAWRRAYPEVVTAAELVRIDATAGQCEAMVGHFGAEQILLELLTDDQEDGWALAQWMTENVDCPTSRREFAQILERWSADISESAVAPDTPPIRLAIFGGKVRDESKLQSLFDATPFHVSWKPYEKSQGNPDDKDVGAAVAQADAVLFVTNMISHPIMWRVKRFARLYGTPCKAVPRATDRYFKEVLADLFPDLSQALG